MAQILFAISLIGCAQVSSRSEGLDLEQKQVRVVAHGKSWWYCRIKVNREEGEPPNWAMGELVAIEVFAPLLKQYRSDIELWRFHRRAGNDTSGHLFSFIFYSSAATAKRIYDDVENNEVLLTLLQEGQLDGVLFDDVSKLSRPHREDTSDKSWPMIIQKSWPDYIMGVSQMWLNLVESLAKNNHHLDTVEHYQDVHDKLTALWRENGQHVWLHHLNAIYAYNPMLIRY
ncbi:MAG TPA: hypothetical protein ENJ32_09425 [Crenotrichaceae bacterium]|nr:hypothetical protein [Crenotrichaceae bacterium]